MRAGRHESAPSTSAQRHDPGVDQLGDRHRERGLDPEHPRRRLLERALLGLGRVRRVVGGDRVDRAVGERRR